MKILYIIGAVAALSLASCQKQDEPNTEQDPNAVRVEATVADVFTRSKPLEDGAASTVFKSGDVVMVSADAQTAVGYTFNGTTWSAEAGKYLRWDTPTMTFKAWYPSTASMTDFTLPTDQSTIAGVESADYMTYSGDHTKDGTNPISLTLGRKTARVIVKIADYGDEYTGAEKTVSNVKITSGKASYASDVVSGLSVVIASYENTASNTFTTLVIPSTTNATENFVTLTDGKGNTLSVKGIPVMEAGKSYTYELTVGKNTLKVGKVTVSDWATGTTISGGETDAITKAYLDPAFAAVLETYHPAITLKTGLQGKYLDMEDPAVKASVEAVTSLNLDNKNITSLSGIQYFTGLSTLNCSNNNSLTSLDVSKLTNLQVIICTGNALTSLILGSHLSVLDVSQQTKLETLHCFDNKLNTLDISMLEALSELMCGDQKENRQLTLTLTKTQYDTKWNVESGWGSGGLFNERVTPADAGGTPFN